MTHPSRVLNLDMKAKLCMPKSYITIYIYIYIYIYISVVVIKLAGKHVVYILCINLHFLGQ